MLPRSVSSPYQAANVAPGQMMYPQMMQASQGYLNMYNPMNMTGQLSEQSQGGITSKRSHKYLLDSAQPVQSKQDSESMSDEPADPMLEANPVHKNGRVKKSQPQEPSYELDLKTYHSMRQQNLQ